MSSVSSSLGSSSTVDLSSFNPTSKYGDDLKTALNRAVQIAALPIKQLNNQKTDLQQQQTAYTGLQTDIANVNTAVQSLVTAVRAGSYSATSSSPGVASGSITVGALVGTYAINVTNAGAFTQALSNTGLTTVTNPSTQNVITAATFSLNVNGVATTITPATTSLNALATAINQASAGVQATIINIGSTAAPDYRLSLESTTTEDVPIQLTANSTDLMNVVAHGAKASYQVNGQPPAGIETTSRKVTIAPGITAQLETTGSTTITVKRDTNALGTALTSLVQAYNTAMSDLSKFHGPNAGILAGQSEVWTLESTLRNLVNFTGGSGTATSLAQLGLSFDSKGQLSLDTDQLSKATMADVDVFFGDGLADGFIKNATGLFDTLEDPINGSLTAELSSLNDRIKNVDDQIDANQQRVDTMAKGLMAKLSKADATIASLQSQADYFTSLFDAMKQNSRNMTS